MKFCVKVKPNSGEERVVKLSNEEYKVFLKERAENNKANLELVKVLGKYFKKNIKIIKGLRCRNKIVEVEE